MLDGMGEWMIMKSHCLSQLSEGTELRNLKEGVKMANWEQILGGGGGACKNVNAPVRAVLKEFGHALGRDQGTRMTQQELCLKSRFAVSSDRM